MTQVIYKGLLVRKSQRININSEVYLTLTYLLITEASAAGDTTRLCYSYTSNTIQNVVSCTRQMGDQTRDRKHNIYNNIRPILIILLCQLGSFAISTL